MSNKKIKILIVLADVGNGHRSASNAFIQALSNINNPNFEIKALDLFYLADIQPFNSADTSYALISQNQIYEGFNNIGFRIVNTDIGFDLFNWYTVVVMKNECRKIIEEESPDVIISVHPLITMIISAIKKEGNLEFKSVSAITDLVTIFKGWIDKNADLLIAPTLEAKNLLLENGIVENKILYPLFPINPKLENFRSKDVVVKELGFVEDKPIVTMTGGGVGTSSLRKAIKLILKRTDINILVICGKSDALKNELDSRYGNLPNFKTLGYVNNIQDYFNASDIIVGKPGPATILEIELFNKKAILTRPVGEQEKGNIDYALQNPNFRFIGNDWDLLSPTVEDLLKQDLQKNPHNRSFKESQTIMENIIQLAF